MEEGDGGSKKNETIGFAVWFFVRTAVVEKKMLHKDNDFSMEYK